MPWTVGDVDSHKKGLSPSQKKKWVRIANGIYKDCIAGGGSDSTCAPKAIRIANSKFSEEPMKNIENIKLKKAALYFTDHDAFAKVNVKADGEERKLNMVAYSGKIINDHWYWGDLAIDTSGIKLAKKEIPILQDHLTTEKIGFGKFIVDENHQIVAKDSTFVDTPSSQEFIKLSDQGFPYEASIYARPSKIQRLEEKEETEVNGFKMKGPGTVWRESVLRECSVVTFGADANTKSVAMTEDEEMVVEVEKKLTGNEEEVNMELEKLKVEYPELYAQVIALGKTEAETTFVIVKAGLEAQVTALTADKEKLAADNTKLSERTARLEKNDAIRTEQEIKTSADTIFDGKVTNIPQRLRPKIRKQLNHQAFVKDDKLDGAAWAAAIDAELKDWKPGEGEDEGDPAILGMSFTRDVTGSATDTEGIVKRMLSHVGQVTQ